MPSKNNNTTPSNPATLLPSVMLGPPPTGDDTTFRAWTAAVADQLRDLSGDYEDLQQAYENSVEQYKKLNHVITGNGNPEQGVVFRLRMIEETLKTANSDKSPKSQLVNAIINALATALIGGILVALWIGLKALTNGHL